MWQSGRGFKTCILGQFGMAFKFLTVDMGGGLEVGIGEMAVLSVGEETLPGLWSGGGVVTCGLG